MTSLKTRENGCLKMKDYCIGCFPIKYEYITF